MIIEVKGQVFPKVWDLAYVVNKLRDERRIVNIGGGTVGYPVFQVELPDGTKMEGSYLVTPQGIRLYWNRGDQYEVGYLISELDKDPLVLRHFRNSNTQ
jgi:hypothetical protein